MNGECIGQIVMHDVPVTRGVVQMKVIAKLFGKLIGGILYPFFWMLECLLVFVATIFEEIEKLMEEDV